MAFKLSGKSAKEIAAFIGLLGMMHISYYTIQNSSMVHPDARQELFYVRWLKEKFPALKPYGVKEPDHPPKH
ncbi:unnamed protein product, partial [Mesorhabditis spiculigera]